MRQTVQKLSIATTAAITFFIAALPVGAESVALCNGTSDFGNLCTKTFSLSSIINFVIITLLTAAVILCLFFLIWGGIKWVLSGGDKGKVDAARQTIIASLIGLAVAFASYFLLNIVTNVFLGHPLTGFNLPTL